MKNKNFSLLGYHAVIRDNFLRTFRDDLLVPSSRVKNPKIKLVTLYRVYIGQSVGSGKLSVALVGGSGWEGGVKCHQCCFGERHSGRGKP
jgi:hypothetical protein